MYLMGMEGSFIALDHEYSTRNNLSCCVTDDVALDLIGPMQIVAQALLGCRLGKSHQCRCEDAGMSPQQRTGAENGFWTY